MQPRFPWGKSSLFFAPGQTRLHLISQPVPSTKVETKSLISNMLQTDWKTYHAARKDKTAGNNDTSVFTEAWSPKKSIDQRFQTLTTDPDLVLFATDSNKKLLTLHSFKNAGGTLLRPKKKLMCLLGTGALATALEVNPLTLMAECNLVTPTIDVLRECTTAIKVAKVEAPNENGLVTYPGSANFPSSPLASRSSDSGKFK